MVTKIRVFARQKVGKTETRKKEGKKERKKERKNQS